MTGSLFNALFGCGLDLVFDMQGQAADYMPVGGPTVSVRVIITKRGDQEGDAGPVGTLAIQRIAQVRDSEIRAQIGRAPEGGDMIAVAAGAFEIERSPRLSSDGLVWDMGLIEVP